MKRKIFIVLIALITVFLVIEFYKETLPEETRLYHQLIARTSKKLKDKYGVFPIGVGGGKKDGIKLIIVRFEQRGNSKDIPTARRMILDSVQEYLEEINKDEKLRPYLKIFPFNPAYLDLSIFFSSPTGEIFYDPDLEVVGIHNGEIVYCTRDPKDHYQYKSTTYETYEEARAIVQKENEAIKKHEAQQQSQ